MFVVHRTHAGAMFMWMGGKEPNGNKSSLLEGQGTRWMSFFHARAAEDPGGRGGCRVNDLPVGAGFVSLPTSRGPRRCRVGAAAIVDTAWKAPFQAACLPPRARSPVSAPPTIPLTRSSAICSCPGSPASPTTAAAAEGRLVRDRTAPRGKLAANGTKLRAAAHNMLASAGGGGAKGGRGEGG